MQVKYRRKCSIAQAYETTGVKRVVSLSTRVMTRRKIDEP